MKINISINPRNGCQTLIRIMFLLVVIVAAPSHSFGQSLSVTGKVLDEQGLGLPGVSIQIQGRTVGTITNLDGNYTIEALPSDALVFSFLGYKTIVESVGERTRINLTLELDATSLEEVVVVGYGSQKVKDLTSSIAIVKAEDIMKTPSGAVMQAMQGKVAGMQVVSNGVPGGAPTVRIRGVGSYPGKGSNPLNEGQPDEAPLYVVDGVFFDKIDFLNNSDIASISVLKDASAAAIYGVRAANGVVLIETKSGQYNKDAEITYDGYFGVQLAQNVLEMANTMEFTDMALETGFAADSARINAALQRYGRSRENPDYSAVDTDWYKEILRIAPIQNHSLNVSGGTEKASYSVGGSYLSQDGILDMKNNFQRLNLRSKVDFKATKWLTVGANAIVSDAVRYAEEAGAWNLAYFANPLMPVYDESGTAYPEKFANAQDIGFRGGQNPFGKLTYYDNRSDINRLLTSFYAKIDILPNKLSFKSTYSLGLSTINSRNVRLPHRISDDLKEDFSYIEKRNQRYSKKYFDNVLTYSEQFDRSNLTVMLGTSYRDERFDMLRAVGRDFPHEHPETWYLDKVDVLNIDAENVNDDAELQRGLAYFGRVAYNYSNRYLIYGTMRADGTSKYQETWGYFPTVGLGWVISEEAFFSGIKAIDFLKFRASWGQLGNDKIPPSDGEETVEIVETAINDQLVSGTNAKSTFDYLSWELTEEVNFGLTSNLANGRLTLDADYYIRDTKDAAIPVKPKDGSASVLRNVGTLRNSGFEIAMGWNDRISEHFSYSLSGNFSTLKNEVMNLGGQPHIDGGQAEFLQRSIVGSPIFGFFGQQVIGVYQNQAEIDSDPTAVAQNELNPASPVESGDFKYVDQNGDGVIDGDDRVILGSYLPTYMYGFNANFIYRNFEFSVSFVGQGGNKILNRKRGQLIWTNDGNLDADLARNRWHGEGTSNIYPSSRGLRKAWNQKMSTYFVEDGGFFRIQNVQLAYNLNDISIAGKKLPDIRVFLTADRPLTLFNYNGFSPEVPNGIDTQTYPIPSVYTIGLSVRF